MGIARHSTTAEAQATVRALQALEGEEYVIIAYPTIISGMSTSELWDSIAMRTEYDAVNRLLSKVERCNMDLIWKSSMCDEIRRIAVVEGAYKEEKEAILKLYEWRTVRRPEKLERLYEVREMFEKRRDVARGKLRGLKEERRGRDVDGDVDGELGGVMGFMGIDENTRWDSDSDGDDEDEDDGGIEGEEAKGGTAKHRKATGMMKYRMQGLNMKAKLEEGERLREEARRREAEKEEASKTQDERLCEALLGDLERRLAKVDELLENLQEEEWEEEEEDYGDLERIVNSTIEGEGSSGSEEQVGGMGLLDKILAMVLGSLPIEPGRSKEDWFKEVRRLHVELKHEWKSEFHRFPSIQTNGSSQGNQVESVTNDATTTSNLSTDGFDVVDGDHATDSNIVSVTDDETGNVDPLIEQIKAEGVANAEDDWETLAALEDISDGDLEEIEDAADTKVEPLIISTPSIVPAGPKTGFRPGGRISSGL